MLVNAPLYQFLLVRVREFGIQRSPYKLRNQAMAAKRLPVTG
jgi:hypothetical protein